MVGTHRRRHGRGVPTSHHKQRGFFWGGGYSQGLGEIGAAGITAAATITGDQIAQQTQEETNAANMSMNQSNQNFNAFQAVLGRDFSAQQTKQQEQFQQQQVTQQEDYQTQMSDTAYQRGMASAKAAGLNPLLAVPGGGASTPTGAAMPGSAVPGPTASSPPMIPMQNPGASWQNLGGGVGSAIQSAQAVANTDLTIAQTNKTNKEAGVKMDADIEYVKAQTGLAQNQSQQVLSNIGLMEQQANEAGQGAELKGAQMNYTMVLQQLASQDLATKKATMDLVISAASSDAEAKKLGLTTLRNWAQANQGEFGQMIAKWNAILQPISSAAGAAKNISGALQ